MNGAVLLAGGLVFFLLAYRFYGRMLEKIFGVEAERTTPALSNNDGVDYVPARPSVLFGHHFASIAGAGPIVGPIMAAHFGWAAVALWVLLGCVFIGAVHDFAAMFLSVRHNSRSIGTVIESLMGYWGRILFLCFCWFALILVAAVFANLVAKAFVSKPEVATASALFILLALVFGFVITRLRVTLTKASFVFVPIMFGCVYIGNIFPADLTRLLHCSSETAILIWTLFLLAYCYVASVLPVWMLLQPRDYLNSYLLYAMMALGVIGIFVAQPALKMDTFSGLAAFNPAIKNSEFLFPMLFVTVACGACSGFHALVASGTTSKQLASECHLRPIAYGGMLVEGFLALIALVAVAWMTSAEYADALGKDAHVIIFARGLAGFTKSVGVPVELGVTFVSLALSAFLMTTLDTATRLARFTWQELFLPRGEQLSADTASTGVLRKLRFLTGNRFVATLCVVGVTGLLILGGGSRSIWPVFASCNQLLAALTLLGTTLWLIKNKKRSAFIFFPLLFMLVTSGTATVMLFKTNLNGWLNDGFSNGGMLAIVSGCLMVMSALLIVFGVKRLKESV